MSTLSSGSMQQNPQPKPWSKSQIIAVAIGGALLIVSLVAGYRFAASHTTAGPIPGEIQRKLTFSPFVLSRDAKNFQVSEVRFSTAEGQVNVLSFKITSKNSPAITLSQYPQPEQFSDIPEYKERFLSNVAKQYATVQTAGGTIYLGHMTRQNNQQLGILLEKGLLVFMSPAKDVDQATWRQLGDQLEIQKITH